MKWNKLGQIFYMSPINDFLVSHASNPLAVRLEGNVYRIFFSGRNIENKSSVGFVDIDLIKRTVIKIGDNALVTFGAQNSFYSHGISIGNMYTQDQRNYILFMGWNIPKGQHWRGEIGQLELTNNCHLNVTANIPFLGLDQEDKISLSYPFVLFDEGIYKMWYGSTLTWEAENGEMVHVIKYATSKDGIHWNKHGIAIPYEIGVAQAFSRPVVIKEEDGMHMWYSYRSGDGTKYRIGYSYSMDGINWERQHDKLGLSVSEEGWDSEMVCYPFVFKHKESIYMLYNGNDYGKEGFGLAILER